MQRGKRWPFAVLVATGLALGSGCSRSTPDVAAGQTACTDPRPEACTRDYVPVCAALKEGGTRTYSNACSACADATVVGHRPGECS